MTHKKNLFLSLVLLTTSLPAMAQNSNEHYHDLRGMIDTAGVVHLFYRALLNHTASPTPQTDSVYDYDTITRSNQSFIFAGEYGTDLYRDINDYAFFYNNPDNYIYTVVDHSISTRSRIIRCETSQGCPTTYIDSLGTPITTIGMADSSSRVYASVLGSTLISTDKGYHWHWMSIDTTKNGFILGPGFLSVTSFNENKAFFFQYKSDKRYLVKSTDGGSSFSRVDSISASGNWVPHFYYDRDTLHVYAMLKVNKNNKIWYELHGSDKQGNTDSWKTLFRDTARYYVSLDPEKTGVLYIACNKNIYKFTNYGSAIKLSATPWQTLDDTIRGIYKHPAQDIVYALTDSSLLKVTPSGIHTLSRITTGIEQPGSNQVPGQFVLHQNYPNPFNPSTTIRYEVVKAGPVRLTVYNVLGQQVSVLVDARQSAGSHQVTFNASQLASGLYFYRLRAGNKVFVKKMLLMK